jgi:hypothetical protein
MLQTLATQVMVPQVVVSLPMVLRSSWIHWRWSFLIRVVVPGGAVQV